MTNKQFADEIELEAQLLREENPDEFSGFSQEDRDLEEKEIAEADVDYPTNI